MEEKQRTANRIEIAFKSHCQADAMLLIGLVEERDALQAQLTEMRKALWLTHGHVDLYGDDGEMQCGQCVVDFKRATPDEFARWLNALLAQHLYQHQAARAACDIERTARIAAEEKLAVLQRRHDITCDQSATRLEHWERERTTRQAAEERAAKLEADNKTLRGALDFYAEKENYIWQITDNPDNRPAVDRDNGQRARQALAATQGEAEKKCIPSMSEVQTQVLEQERLRKVRSGELRIATEKPATPAPVGRANDARANMAAQFLGAQTDLEAAQDALTGEQLRHQDTRDERDAALAKIAELEVKVAYAKSGRLTDGEYLRLGSPDGWEWLTDVQMWERHTQGKAEAQARVAELETLCIKTDFISTPPYYRQGLPNHEVEEIATAKEVNGLVAKIAELETRLGEATRLVGFALPAIKHRHNGWIKSCSITREQAEATEREYEVFLSQQSPTPPAPVSPDAEELRLALTRIAELEADNENLLSRAVIDEQRADLADARVKDLYAILERAERWCHAQADAGKGIPSFYFGVFRALVDAGRRTVSSKIDSDSEEVSEGADNRDGELTKLREVVKAANLCLDNWYNDMLRRNLQQAVRAATTQAILALDALRAAGKGE